MARFKYVLPLLALYSVTAKSWASEQSVVAQYQWMVNDVAIASLLALSTSDSFKLEKEMVSAAEKGDNKKIVALLAKGVSVNAKDGLISALHAAVAYDQISTAKLLISKGANVDIRSDEQATPLFEAAANGNVKMLTLLLESGAQIEAKSAFGDTALFRAIGLNKVEAVEFLLMKGASPNVVTRHGTALDVARKLKRKEIESILVKQGAK